MQKLHLNRFPFRFNLILFPNYRSLWDSLNNWTIFSLYLYWLQRRVAPVVVAGSALAWCHVEVRRLWQAPSASLWPAAATAAAAAAGWCRRRWPDPKLAKHNYFHLLSSSTPPKMITIESLGQGASTTTFGPTHSDVGTGLSQQKISMGQAATVVAHPTATYPAGRPATLHGIWTYKIRVFKSIIIKRVMTLWPTYFKEHFFFLAKHFSIKI